MLRNTVLVLAWALLGVAAVIVLWAPEAWPMLAMAALLVLGTVYERFHYRGGEDPSPRGGNWQATSERFRDEASGQLVTVWFNPATGERRYVEAGESPPAG